MKKIFIVAISSIGFIACNSDSNGSQDYTDSSSSTIIEHAQHSGTDTGMMMDTNHMMDTGMHKMDTGIHFMKDSMH